jgi:hypothetical protein
VSTKDKLAACISTKTFFTVAQQPDSALIQGYKKTLLSSGIIKRLVENKETC